MTTTLETVDTTGWTVYGYEYDGRKYETALKPATNLWYQIARLEVGERFSLFTGALAQLVGNGATDSEVQQALDKINAGGSYCVVRLAKEAN